MLRSVRVPALLGDAGVYTMSNVLNAALPFLLVPVLTRMLTPADYGIVAMFGIVVNAFAAFTGLNSNSAVTVRYFELSPERFREYLGACFAILAGSTLGLVILLIPALTSIERWTQVPSVWLLLAVVVAVSQYVVSIRLIIWQVARRPWSYGGLVVGQSAIGFATAILLVVVVGLSWEGAAAGQLLGALAAAALALTLLMRGGEVVPRASMADVKDALRYGIPLVPHIVGGLMISSIDRLLIVNLLGVSQAGIYMVALQVGMALGVLTASFNKAYLPWLLGRLTTSDEARDVRIVLGTYSYFLVVLLFATALALLAPLLLTVLVGDEFRVAASAVKYVAFAYAFGGMYYMVTNYIFFAGRTGHLAWITLVAGSVGVAMSYYLIGVNGIDGAGQAYLLSHVILFAGTWILAHRVRPMPWFRALRQVPALWASR